jgi:hypothetical protein
MNGFVESRYAWKGPFDRSSVRRATSTRQTPFSIGQGSAASPAGFTELVYIATAGQKTFSFNTPDHYGNTATINTSNWIEVTASGLRFAQDDGTGFGGYTINYGANAITFLWPRGAGEVVLIDIFYGGTPGSTESEIPISQLPLAGPLFGGEDIPIIQNGITCRATATAIGSVGAVPTYLNKVLSLIYVATAGQTIFPLNQTDRYGNTYILTENTGIEVTAGGNRLVQDDGTGFGGYTINMTTNTVIFLHPLGLGEVVVFDIYALGDQTVILEPEYLYKVLSLIYVAGAAQTVFPLNTPDRYGNVYTLTINDDLQVTAGGNRLVIDDGTGFGGYTINLANNSVVFLHPLGQGEIVTFDVYALLGDRTVVALESAIRMDVLQITTQNVFPSLGYVPDGAMIILFVNRTAFFAAALPPDFIMSGATILWQNAHYSVPPGAQVTAVYTYHPNENPIRTEALTIVTENVIPPLTYTPDGQMIMLFVNRTAFFAAGSPPDFAFSGNTITWENAHFSVPPGAQVIAVYTHL